MKLFLRRILLASNDIYIAYLALRHPRTPLLPKLLSSLLLFYILFPFDFLPDFLPLLGYADELILTPLVLSAVYRLIPADVRRDCQARAAAFPLRRRLIFWAAALTLLLLGLLLFAYVSFAP